VNGAAGLAAPFASCAAVARAVWKWRVEATAFIDFRRDGPDGVETFVLIRSVKLRERERAMHVRFARRLRSWTAAASSSPRPWPGAHSFTESPAGPRVLSGL